MHTYLQDTLPAEASVEALLDGALVHSWDANTIMSLEGVVTVFLEHVTPGKIANSSNRSCAALAVFVDMFCLERMRACMHAKDHVRARAGRHALVAHMPGFQDDQGAISSSIYFNVMPAGE